MQINFYFKGACINRVRCIKAIRWGSGLGLKDAKNLVEYGEKHMASFWYEPMLDDQNKVRYTTDDVIQILQENGASVDTGNWDKYIDSFREIATAATLAGDYYVAKSVIEFLERNTVDADTDTD